MADFSDLGGQSIDFSDLGGQAIQQPPRPQKGRLRQIWDVANAPSRAAESGIKQLTDFIPEPPSPTGNLPLDIALGAPSILTKAGGQAVGKVAASFVDPISIATTGASRVLGLAAKPAGAALRTIGESAEEASGLGLRAPGALEAVFKDPSILFAKGKKAASAIYQAGKEASELRTSEESLKALKNIGDPKKYVEMARKLALKGELGETEALEARKALGAIRKRVRPDYFAENYQMFNDTAKQNSLFANADAAYKRGVQAQELRKIFPQNKLGGASPFRTFTALEMAKAAGKVVPGLKYVVAPLMSPLLQGGTAAGLGLATKAVAPAMQVIQSLPGAAATKALLSALAERRNNK